MSKNIANNFIDSFYKEKRVALVDHERLQAKEQLQLKAELYAKEVVYGSQPSGSNVPAPEDSSATAPSNIMIDRALTPSETEEGNSRGDMPKDGEV
ncbi:hypothetical protein GQ55_3G383200 [Panicum hallii var. hallii]|uniref:Uncharacterized protein n=1 Tax=Panicum hallii var. hallii TaxID=1504633 RepID=A0A2T7EGE1_9POAL|nr:hypothetical protein GQ55_3G383200 [Panicum hallii var. hallii]